MNTIDNTICMYCESDKRTDHISWDEYFMGVAKLSSLRSKDPSTQVGACIIDPTSKKYYQLDIMDFHVVVMIIFSHGEKQTLTSLTTNICM